jgi:hypothetical protein
MWLKIISTIHRNIGDQWSVPINAKQKKICTLSCKSNNLRLKYYSPLLLSVFGCRWFVLTFTCWCYNTSQKVQLMVENLQEERLLPIYVWPTYFSFFYLRDKYLFNNFFFPLVNTPPYLNRIIYECFCLLYTFTFFFPVPRDYCLF